MQVYQRALNLLGQAILYEPSLGEDPSIGDFIELVSCVIKSATVPDKLRSSALGALAYVARHPSAAGAPLDLGPCRRLGSQRGRRWNPGVG